MKLREPKIVDWAWAAGIIDGEGSIHVSHNRKILKKSGIKRRYPKATIAVVQSAVNLGLLLRLQTIVGGTINGPYTGHSRLKNQKPYYLLSVTKHAEWARATKGIKPYLDTIKSKCVAKVNAEVSKYKSLPKQKTGPKKRHVKA